MIRRQSGHAVLIISIIIIAIVVLGLLGWVFWQNFNKATGSSVANFEQCKAATGSKTLETFPEQCVTSDGRTFTGPSTDTAVKTKTYCADAEKLCFEYADGWTIEKLTIDGAEPGAKADRLEISSPKKDLQLTLETGIGGLGGSCPDEFKTNVTVLEATPVASMSGYKDDFSIDMLQVARVYYPFEGKYITSLYLTDTADYSTPGIVNACGLGFSQFINGKNAILSADFAGAGSFRFGYFGSTATTMYPTEAEAKTAFQTDVYKQAAALLASTHYE